MTRALFTLIILAILGSCTAQRQAAERTAAVPTTAVAIRPVDHSAPEIIRAELMQGGWLVGHATADLARIVYAGEDITPAPDGTFFIGFDRDAQTDAALTLVFTDGVTRDMSLTLAPGSWQLQNVNAPYRGSASSDAEFERMRGAELQQIAEARAIDTGATGWRQRFVWPVEGRISGWFGAQRVYQGKPGPYHGGLDIAVPTGTPFVAPAEGTVILASKSPFTLEGYLLMIDHGGGLNSAFLHCSEILVREGEQVKQGDIIGKVGATGRATGPHLHWGLKWRDARIDPLLILERPDLQAGR